MRASFGWSLRSLTRLAWEMPKSAVSDAEATAEQRRSAAMARMRGAWVKAEGSGMGRICGIWGAGDIDGVYRLCWGEE